MKKIKTLLVISGLFLLFSFSFLGCNSTGEKKNSENDVIRIGAILPLTGKLSIMGEVEKNAMILAVNDVNKENRVVEIIFEDSKGTAKDAVAAANKLINIDNVDLLFTSTTGASLAVEPVSTERRKNLIAFCMDPDIAGKSPYVIRYYIGIDEEANAINNYFNVNKEKVDRVGIVYAMVPALEKVAKNTYIPFLKDLDIKVPLLESYEIGESNFRTTVLKIKEANLDHLIILGYGFEYPHLFEELKRNDILEKLQILGGWGFLYTQVDPTLLEGVLVSGPDYVFKNQELAGKFYNDYYNAYGSFPNFDAAFAYNVISSVAKHLKKEDFSNPIEVKFTKVDSLKGVVGTYYFTKDGSMIISTGLGVYRNGRIVEIEK